jgi:hypothetical protein
MCRPVSVPRATSLDKKQIFLSGVSARKKCTLRKELNAALYVQIVKSADTSSRGKNNGDESRSV